MAATGSRPRYSLAQKLEVVRFAQAHSVKAACSRFHVARSSVYIWSVKRNEGTRSTDTVHPREAVRTVAARNSLPEATVATGTPIGTLAKPTDDSEDAEASGQAHLSNSTRFQEQTIMTPDANDSEAQAGMSVPGFAHDRAGDVTSPPAADQAAATAFALVGYQGSNGGFAQLSAQRTFDDLRLNRALPAPSFELTGYPQASHVLDALHKNEIDYAYIATDVLLSNTHHAALDRLVASRLRMVGEVVSQDEVGVCALPGTELCDADCVVSDWSTLQRYEEYILHLEMQYGRRIYRQVCWDSAAGCRIVHEEQAKNAIVLCSASAAIAHGLVVLQGRAQGVPSPTRYSVLGRHGTAPLAFEDIRRDACPVATTRRCTLFVKGTERATLDVISAFAYRGLEIMSFHMRGGDDEDDLRSYVISYRASADPSIEIGLQRHLASASERVIILGSYTTYTQ